MEPLPPQMILIHILKELYLVDYEETRENESCPAATIIENAGLIKRGGLWKSLLPFPVIPPGAGIL